jgi:hypothetical protein
MINRILKAQKIEPIEVLRDKDDPNIPIIAHFEGQNDTIHQVSCLDNKLLCTCDDYHYRSGFGKEMEEWNMVKNEDSNVKKDNFTIGSFLCKHCISLLFFLAKEE